MLGEEAKDVLGKASDMLGKANSAKAIKLRTVSSLCD
jgi:hypothetical protein